MWAFSKACLGAGEIMDQLLSASAIPQDVGSVPSTHVEDSQCLELCSKGPNALF